MQTLIRLPDGHSLRSDNWIQDADRDGGYIDTDRPLTESDGILLIPLRGGHWTPTNLETLLYLAYELRMPINVGDASYMLYKA